MAAIVDNPKGFKVIEISRSEILDKMAKHGSVGICDDCGTPHSKDGFYIAVLNRWYCPKCYNEWLARAKWYHEDEHYETSHFELYRKVFNV